MNIRIFFLVIILGSISFTLGISLPETASAQDETWSVSSANWMQYWLFTEDNNNLYSANRDSLDNRLIVDFNLGNFYTGMWLDILQLDRPDNSKEEISQRYFGWQYDGITIHGGNFYQVFDRGLTLNAFLDDVVDFDNNLDGIKVSAIFNNFDFDAFSARALNKLTNERQYTLRGARGALRLFSPFKVGMSYVRFKENDLADFFKSRNTNITGINSGFSNGFFDFYAEYATKRGRETLFSKNGDGTYLSASIVFEKISIYSDYRNIVNLIYPSPSNPFNAPPPVSHNGRTLTDLASVPGERAYQIGVLYSPSFDFNIELAFSESFSRGDPRNLYLAEKFASLRWQTSDNLVFNYSWDRTDYKAGPASTNQEDEIENYFDSYYYLNDFTTLSLVAHTKKFVFGTSNIYHENYLTLGCGIANTLQLNVGGSTSNKDSNSDPDKLAFAELTIRLGNNELVIFQGGERGGIICSSGICQLRPTFQGTRIILFSRF